MKTILMALGALAAAVVVGPGEASAQAPIGIVRVPAMGGGGRLGGGFGGVGFGGGGIRGPIGGVPTAIGRPVGGLGVRPAVIAQPGIAYRPGAIGRPGFGYGYRPGMIARPGFGYGYRPGVIARPGFGRYGGAYRPFYGGYYGRGWGYPNYGYYRRGWGYPNYGYYRRRYYGGALAAGLIGGLALGSIASYGYGYPAYGYGYPYYGAGQDCYMVRRRYVAPRGRVLVRRVWVCDY
jgi:hypothetical protein